MMKHKMGRKAKWITCKLCGVFEEYLGRGRTPDYCEKHRSIKRYIYKTKDGIIHTKYYRRS